MFIECALLLTLSEVLRQLFCPEYLRPQRLSDCRIQVSMSLQLTALMLRRASGAVSISPDAWGEALVLLGPAARRKSSLRRMLNLLEMPRSVRSTLRQRLVHQRLNKRFYGVYRRWHGSYYNLWYHC